MLNTANTAVLSIFLVGNASNGIARCDTRENYDG